MPTAMMRAIDISSVQGDNRINLNVVPRDITIMKVSQGDYYVNKYAAGWEPATRGQLRAFYHYLDYRVPAQAQFSTFARVASKWIDNTTRVCLDYEPFVNHTLMDGRAVGTEFMRLAAKEFGNPFWYMSQYAAESKQYPWSYASTQYDLWVAAYPTMKQVNGYPAYPPITVRTWPHVIGHQFTSTGRLPGYAGNLDLSLFYLTPQQWKPAPIVKDWFSMATPADLTTALRGLIPDIAQAVSDEVWSRMCKDRNDGQDYPAVEMLIGARDDAAIIKGTTERLAQTLAQHVANATPSVTAQFNGGTPPSTV